MLKLLEIPVENTLISFWLQFAVSCAGQSYLSRLWLPAGERSMWRAKEVQGIGQNAILDPTVYCLTVI